MIAVASLVAAVGMAGRRRFVPPRAGRLVAFTVVVLSAVAVEAAAIHTVSQRHRNFVPAQIAIARGDSIRFTNDDEFLHQIYIDSKEMNFDSDEQRPGQTIEVSFPRAGTFAVRCHIHPKMRLTVQVQ
jgi:plastocyanin